MMNKTPTQTKPKTQDELLTRARALAGKTLSELSTSYSKALPKSHKDAKGFVGKLVEWYLGADESNLPQPDFFHLGIELKTLPLNAKGLAQESTYICTAPYTTHETWLTSRVRCKLNQVLWIPFEADKDIPFAQRSIGQPLLWQLTPDIETILARDWEELTTVLQLGQSEKLSAKVGEYLQIRPKAANSRVLYKSYNQDGEETYINPKGFYLRTTFTNQILKHYYCIW